MTGHHLFSFLKACSNGQQPSKTIVRAKIKVILPFLFSNLNYQVAKPTWMSWSKHSTRLCKVIQICWKNKLLSEGRPIQNERANQLKSWKPWQNSQLERQKRRIKANVVNPLMNLQLSRSKLVGELRSRSKNCHCSVSSLQPIRR